MDEAAFARLVSLACHDLRTPLATIVGFARTLTRTTGLDDQQQRWIGLIDEAAVELDGLIDLLSIAARVEGGRFSPERGAVGVADLAPGVESDVAVITDRTAASIALAALLRAAERHGKPQTPMWRMRDAQLLLGPLTAQAAAVLSGSEERDLGALVARRVLDALDATISIDGEDLAVAFPR